ncbi:DUF4340 domain-containing protein [Methylogaea oryzae]|uniref:DUF4340 domain-containing protein n=1 Tax=Methylogaea oryzae TaxID=1295382 RepID=UPI0006D03597|nr:DUF4340 domain-containing protein [Methylogaea oryzae]
MSDKMKLNLALLAVVAVLGLLVVLEPGKKKDEPHPLAQIDTQSINKIQVSGRQNFTLEKRDGHWRLTQPLDVPAAENRVEQLLKIPSAPSDTQYPVDAAQLAKFQLAPPNATLALGDLVLEFGGSDPIQQQRYVKLGNSLHLVTDNFYQHLTAAPTDYVEKKLLPENANIHGIELPGLKLSKDKDGKWTAEPPQAEAAPLYEMAEAWKNARAYDVRSYTPMDGKMPTEKATIRLADGQSVEFLVAQREPDASWCGRIGNCNST